MANCKYCGKRYTAMEVVCKDCTENMESVVYCKDCIYGCTHQTGVIECCVMEGITGDVKATDFCSRGRTEEEKQ